MENVSKDNSELDEQILNKFYYYHLWKDRLSWTGHIIPVKVKHPSGYFFIEAYIDTPPKIVSLSQKVTVKSAIITELCIDEFEVFVTDVFPSKRPITKLIVQDNNITTELLDSNTYQTFIKFDTNSIEHIFAIFPNVSFTIFELENMINKPIPVSFQDYLIKTGKKYCIMTSKILDCYHGLKKVTVSFDNVIINQPSKKSAVYPTLKDIHNAYLDCTKCELGTERVNRNAGGPVFARNGNISLPSDIPNKNLILFLGEAPGAQEELEKIPFSPNAPAGNILDKVIAAAGIDQQDCYFTNAVLCRPKPKDPSVTAANIAPAKNYIDACNSRLKNEIAIIKPKIIVILGKSAYISFYGQEPKPNILSLVGWQTFPNNTYLLPHPSFVARELSFAVPENKVNIKQRYLEHFQQIKKRFNE